MVLLIDLTQRMTDLQAFKNHDQVFFPHPLLQQINYFHICYPIKTKLMFLGHLKLQNLTISISWFCTEKVK